MIKLNSFNTTKFDHIINGMDSVVTGIFSIWNAFFHRMMVEFGAKIWKNLECMKRSMQCHRLSVLC